MSGLVPLPAQPAGVPWPTGAWPEGELPPAAENAIAPLLDAAFDDASPIATTYAVVIVRHGRIVLERYHGALEHFDRPPTPVDATTPLLSWSMAKSVQHAVVGLLVGEHRLDLDAPAPVPEWSGPDDARRAITLRQLLAMRDGLDWTEDYVDDKVSDVIEMLFGEHQGDMAHFAADRSLAAPPDTRFNYSSGTSNIVSGVVARTIGPGEDYARFLHRRLFDPLGMASADPEFDEAGTWVASSYLRATARDWARFGLFYLRDGVWDGVRLLPAGWVDYARTMVSLDDEGEPYGAHWWGEARGDHALGTFRAAGYEGQSITVCPPLDLVVVRLGKTPYEREANLDPWRVAMVQAFAGAG
ncbi:MAG TPA: serine hydrolase [Acidimicrobiales bacterium]|nr:serine hydrolase [Acidimicrobiales bacterium]